VHVQVKLTNYREAILARLGQPDASQVHRYVPEALIDTGATRAVLPPTVAERLGLIRLDHIEAQYANGTFEEVDLSEVFTIEMLGRRVNEDAMIMGAHILLGVTVLEKLDLIVDCNRNRLVPYQGTWDQPVFRV